MTDQVPAPSGNALVTGAATRIGRAIALGLAESGWNIGIHYNGSHDAAQATADDCAKLGVKTALVQANLADDDETAKAFGDAQQAMGPITLLINNASLFEFDDFSSATNQSWHDHMQVNLHAPFILSQALAHGLPRDVAGNIINLIDQRVWKLTPDFTSYTLSKAGLWTLTQTAAQALAPRVRVNAIAPGPTLKSSRQSEESFAQQVAAVPLQIQPGLEEFTNAVAFILASPSLTGQMIALDGGQHLAWETPDVVGVDE